MSPVQITMFSGHANTHTIADILLGVPTVTTPQITALPDSPGANRPVNTLYNSINTQNQPITTPYNSINTRYRSTNTGYQPLHIHPTYYLEAHYQPALTDTPLTAVSRAFTVQTIPTISYSSVPPLTCLCALSQPTTTHGRFSHESEQAHAHTFL